MDCFADCPFKKILETTVVEDVDYKHQLRRQLNGHCPDEYYTSVLKNGDTKCCLLLFVSYLSFRCTDVLGLVGEIRQILIKNSE